MRDLTVNGGIDKFQQSEAVKTGKSAVVTLLSLSGTKVEIETIGLLSFEGFQEVEALGLLSKGTVTVVSMSAQ